MMFPSQIAMFGNITVYRYHHFQTAHISKCAHEFIISSVHHPLALNLSEQLRSNRIEQKQCHVHGMYFTHLSICSRNWNKPKLTNQETSRNSQNFSGWKHLCTSLHLFPGPRGMANESAVQLRRYTPLRSTLRLWADGVGDSDSDSDG